MAFQGAVDYLDTRSRKMRWNSEITLRIPEDKTKVELRAPVTNFVVDEILRSPGLLVLDTRFATNVRKLKCLVICKEDEGEPEGGLAETYHVIVIAPSGEKGDAYERCGIASVQNFHIALEAGEEARLV